MASATTSSLPAGTDNLYAVYSGDTHFSGSTSPVRVQTVIGLPPKCTGTYPNFFYGNPHFPFILGTNGDDFIYAFGASYIINGFGGNDCIWAGDGNNWISDGNGNDVVIAGNGSNSVERTPWGNGSTDVRIDTDVGNGYHNQISVGNGADTITVGTGTYNSVAPRQRAPTRSPQSRRALTPTHNDIDGGAGNETIYLGSGYYNTYSGRRTHTNTCHLPKPPSSWHGTVAAYYHDTITNCTVVSP